MQRMNPFGDLLRVTGLMAGFKRPWLVAGGWAVDLYLGCVTRTHRDIDIAVLRDDQLDLQQFLRGWGLEQVLYRTGGRREPWAEGERLELPVHEIHAYRDSGDLQDLEILLNESSGTEWRYRRNLSIARPLSMIGMRSEMGIPFLSPEIVLLYKAAYPADVNNADFEKVCEVLVDEARRWLGQAVETCHPGHEWLARL